ncbi:MAG: LLM class flavin-dependent oxidoreductase, partial [Mycobacterium sp.]
TFRYPGPLAITVAQVDEMSGGRVELGLGAGWFEAEHKAYAIPFPPLGERFDRLTEQLSVIRGLWTTPPGETFDYSGSHYSVADSPALPKPVQSPHPPIIIGGAGAKRTPALADAGRAPESLTYSAAFVVCAGRDEREIARRADGIGREVDELRSNSPLVGTPAEIADKLGAYRQIGVQRAYLQVLDMSDLDHVDFFAAEVIPQLS